MKLKDEFREAYLENYARSQQKWLKCLDIEDPRERMLALIEAKAPQSVLWEHARTDLLPEDTTADQIPWGPYYRPSGPYGMGSG